MKVSEAIGPYTGYKKSGIGWLGEVPEHWDVRRLRDSTEGCINGIWGNEPNGHDDLTCVRVADFDRQRLRVRLTEPTMRAITADERRRRMLKRGDLLLEKSGGGELQPVGVVMLYDHDLPAVSSNFVARMPVASGFDARFLTYLHSHLYAIRLNVRSIKQTTGIQNLDSSAYLGESVAFPSLAEQAAIARFLGHADRQIRQFIVGKQKLIKLLEEQKSAIIKHAVTRGFNPKASLKPSGVPWVGDVPEHWSAMRLKFIASDIVDCLHATPIYSEDGVYPAIRTADVTPGALLLSTVRRVDDEHYRQWTQRLTPSEEDILYTREGERFGIAALVPPGVKLCISQRMMAFRIKPAYNSAYIMWQINCPHVYAQAAGDLIGAAAPHVNVERIKNFWLLTPPRSEQDEIVAKLEDETAEISAAIQRTRDEIRLLREYRVRLIADVVTGKLDVRKAAASLPDEVEGADELSLADALEDADDDPELASEELTGDEVIA